MKSNTSSPATVSPSSPSQPDEILDRIGVAKLLALTPTQIDERVRTRAGQNRIPHHCVGAKTIRFIRSEVLQWLISQPQNTKRDYRLSPAARRRLVQRNKQRQGGAV